MVGIIHRREQVKSSPEPPFNPDNYFDPSTHIATEANFIKLLQDGYYEESLIGYKVQLSNSATYNNGLWVIADVNHDSVNTGQSNCYDLISEQCFNIGSTFGSNQYWRDSNPRTWLNNTLYPGFSIEFKNHILNPKYNSQGIWYTDDKVISPSFVEVFGENHYSQYRVLEGSMYHIFDGGASSRKKYGANTTTYQHWWTRSRDTSTSNRVWRIYSDGGAHWTEYYQTSYVVGLLRIQ